MDALFTYLFKSAISLALFFVLYQLTFKNDTFFSLKRFYFLFVVVFSFIFPAINFELENNTAIADLPIYWFEFVDFTVNASAVAENHWDWTNFLFILLLAGSGILIARFVLQVLSLSHVVLKNRNKRTQNKYIETDTLPTFSFFKLIVINTKGLSSSEIEDVIAHEKLHVRQWHSIDTIIFELLSVCMWWNPFVWFLKKEMKLNLEYLADESVQRKKIEKVSYQHLLLKINANTGVALVNNFNVSQLKKRITMMNKNRTSAMMSLKLLFAIPLGCIIFMGNALYAAPELIEENISKLEESFLFETVQKVTEPQKKEKPQKQTVEFTPPLIMKDKSETSQKNEDAEDKVLSVIEQMPQFVGGDAKMMEYLNDNIKYPANAVENGIQGRVVVRFIVSKEGDVKDVKVVRPLDPSLDQEALRIVRAMPRWVPGKHSGRPTAAYYTLPVTFRIPNDEKKEDAINLDGKNIYIKLKAGKELTLAEAQNIDPKDIESMEVIKDKSEMKKYTSSDYDGVILITLKK